MLAHDPTGALRRCFPMGMARRFVAGVLAAFVMALAATALAGGGRLLGWWRLERFVLSSRVIAAL